MPPNQGFIKDTHINIDLIVDWITSGECQDYPYIVLVYVLLPRNFFIKMKAIILTFSPVTDEDAVLLQNTDITKIAINQHAEELNPDLRIVSDYGIVGILLEQFSQKIVTLRDYANNDRLIYAGHIPFKGSTMVATIEWLISKDYDDILIVGDNTVHSEIFKERVNKEIDVIRENRPDIKIFQYTNGNFNLPVKTIEQFVKGERNGII